MTANRAIKFWWIANLFKDDEMALRRGEKSYTGGFVKNMTFRAAVEPALLKGDVYASMKKRVYNIEISVNMKNGEMATHCTCPRGLGRCHHMASLLYYAHYNISSTDKEREWGTTSSKPVDDEVVQTVEELFDSKENYVAIKNDEQLNVDDFKKILGESNVVGYTWLLKPEVDESLGTLIPAIATILFSEQYLTATDKVQYLQEACVLSQQQIYDIAQATVGQHKNELWMIGRKARLTASKFGLVLNAIRRNKYPPSLFKSLLEGYSLDRVRAVLWGKDNEQAALAKFVEKTGLEVTPTGLWMHECGFLGASPDALIGNDSILEIKCPYSMRNTNVKEGILNLKNKYFFSYEGDEVKIDFNHNYYHQIQGQLYLTGRQNCYFFVWTPTDCEILYIDIDPEWANNIETLKDFYLNKFITAFYKS